MNITTLCAKMTSASANVDQVEGLQIRHQKVHFMPMFEPSLAKRLEGIIITDCGMKMIEQEDLRQFPNLVTLWLNKNEIQWLEDDFFKFTPKVRIVGFYNNKISMIGANFYEPLSRFNVLLMHGNECTTRNFLPAHGDDPKKLKDKILTKCIYVLDEVAERKRKINDDLELIGFNVSIADGCRKTSVESETTNLSAEFYLTFLLLCFIVVFTAFFILFLFLCKC